MSKKWLSVAIILTVGGFTSLYLGSIPPSPVYYFKITRESIQTFFIFGQEDKANWLLTRADKRLSEAEKLKTKNLNFLAGIQIQTAESYQAEAAAMLEDLKNKTNITYLQDRFNQNAQKIKDLEEN